MYSNFKIRTFSNVYENFEDPLVMNGFSKFLRWKIRSYQPHYPKGFVPLDKSDFFSDHHLFYASTPQGVEQVVSGIKFVKLSQCKFYKTEFPLLSTAKSSGCGRNSEYLKKVCQEQLEKGFEIVYPCGYTVSPEALNSKELVAQTREMIAALHVQQIKRNPKSIFLTASVKRFKTYRWFKEIGYQDIIDEDGPLPDFVKLSAGGEELKLMCNPDLSFWSYRCFEKFKSKIENMKSNELFKEAI